MLGVGELLREDRDPAGQLALRRRLGQQQEVPPVEARVVRRADDEVCAVVGDLGAGQTAHHQVRSEPKRPHVHNRGL